VFVAKSAAGRFEGLLDNPERSGHRTAIASVRKTKQPGTASSSPGRKNRLSDFR